ncbi:MAG TPA: PrsW family glutamic-type intramembrane protease [Halanaerobiales bacterium]|nr:PrsW family glutamic-type intramembrane protease [Halanaerobiales bacterium]
MEIYFLKLFLVSILPGILWVIYFYRQDRVNPEPLKLIIRDFSWGFLLVFPAGILESPFAGWLTAGTPPLKLFLACVFVVGFIEEGLKSYAVYRLHYEHPDFDEPIDGIIYGVTLGLGFATFENLFYTILYGIQVGLTRAFLTTLAHSAFTGIFGSYLSRGRKEGGKGIVWRGFILVAFLHGLYDFLVISAYLILFTSIIIILLLQFYLARLLRDARSGLDTG